MIDLVRYFFWRRNASSEALALLRDMRAHIIDAIQELVYADGNGNFEESMHSFMQRMMQGIYSSSRRERLKAAGGHSGEDALYDKSCVDRMRSHLAKAQEVEELCRKKGIPNFVIRYCKRGPEEKLSYARELWDSHIRGLYTG